MAKKTLIDFSFDFNIWGINSGIEDYRLCQFLNHHMKWKLKRTMDIEFFNRSIKKLEHFNTYTYTNEIDLYTVELIQNKNFGFTLLPELKNIDFLFLLKGEEDYFNEETFLESLSSTPGVQSVLPIDVLSLKSKHNLLISHFNESNKKKN
jgi:hypothetical protein